MYCTRVAAVGRRWGYFVIVVVVVTVVVVCDVCVYDGARYALIVHIALLYVWICIDTAYVYVSQIIYYTHFVHRAIGPIIERLRTMRMVNHACFKMCLSVCCFRWGCCASMGCYRFYLLSNDWFQSVIFLKSIFSKLLYEFITWLE